MIFGTRELKVIKSEEKRSFCNRDCAFFNNEETLSWCNAPNVALDSIEVTGLNENEFYLGTIAVDQVENSI